MKTQAAPPSSAETRQEWAQVLEALTGQVRTWLADEPEWSIERPDTYKPEDVFGAYQTPLLLINTPQGKLALEDKGFNLAGRGIVEFYSWATLRRVFLLHGADGSWQVRVDSGFRLHQPWDREHFIVLVNDLADASDLLDAV